MRYFSVCSGVEAATQAWQPLGWQAVAFAEVEPFPCAVLASRFPTVPNLGDMTKITYNPQTKVLSNGTVDVICKGGIDLLVGGTPCQSFSIAGKRQGLEGASGLAYHFIRLLREIRPRWFVWENVAGAMSSVTNGQRDFNFLLRQYAECGYDIEWRVLDTQYVRTPRFPRAIPQRRRRVFVVGHLRTDGECGCEVLLEPDCLRGYSAPRRVKGKGFAPHFGTCIEAAGESLAVDFYNGTVVSFDSLASKNIECANKTEVAETCRGQSEGCGVGIAIGIGRDAFNSGANAQMAMSITEEVQPPQTAKGGGCGMCKIWTTSNGKDVMPTIDASFAKGVNGQLEDTGCYLCGEL